MIKRILFTLIAILGISSVSMASDKYSHDSSILPKGAQTTLSKNFKSKVSLIKIDKDFGRISEYEVIMNDGSEITFDKDGNWKEIEVGISKSVPTAFVPSGVASYIKSNQKGQKIVGIEKTKGGYEVELSGGLEMKFDKDGKFIRYSK